ncbi:hypothetical protein ACFO3D_13520 [Virgibacillus kekensis]|uniref:Uncharacterized protein n=1 Tax=Virgibacillus kekensis TaxID=202261 RepID=A0ABV9DLH1_9BACI
MRKYSWLSYFSLGIPIVLIMSLFVMPNLPMSQQGLVTTIIYAQIVGVPVTLVLCIIAFFKKSEKKLMALIGFLLALVLIGAMAYLLLLAFNFAP